MAKKMDSLRDRILSSARPRIEYLDTEQCGRVWVRSFSGDDRDRAQAMSRKAGEDGIFQSERWRGRLFAMYLCEEDGSRVFDPETDAEEINALDAAFLEAVIARGHQISGLAPGAVEEAKANFPETPSDDSGSESPATSAE